MRGDYQQQNHMFSYVSPEMRVRKDHPARSRILFLGEFSASMRSSRG
jgi:hypothetical protein